MGKDQLIHVRISSDSYEELNSLIDSGKLKSMSHAVRTAINYYLENQESTSDRLNSLENELTQLAEQFDQLQKSNDQVEKNVQKLDDALDKILNKLEAKEIKPNS